jgi:hypothetical protein
VSFFSVEVVHHSLAFWEALGEFALVSNATSEVRDAVSENSALARPKPLTLTVVFSFEPFAIVHDVAFAVYVYSLDQVALFVPVALENGTIGTVTTALGKNPSHPLAF